MKVLLINALYAPNRLGGAERVVQSLAEGMVQEGHQVTVVSSVPQKGTRVDRINGVKTYYVGLKNVYWPWTREEKPRALRLLWHALDSYNPPMAREVAHILDAERPDLVHTHSIAGFSPLIWKPAKLRGLPLVHTLHEYYLLCPRSTMFRNGENCRTRCPGCRPYALPRKRLSDQADLVVGVSRFVLERHLEFGCFAAASERLVLPNAVDVEPRVLATGKQSLPIRFGYLGRLHPTKGLEVLLESVARLPEKAWSLDIAGQGPAAYERHLNDKYKTSAIRFLGYTSPEAFFSKIDVLVVPSLWDEPLGTVVIEAFAHGMPVIGSRRGGIPELVEDGRTGFLFEPRRPGDLAAKMQRYIDEPTLTDQTRQFCLSRAESFSPANAVKQHLRAYTQVLETV